MMNDNNAIEKTESQLPVAPPDKNDFKGSLSKLYGIEGEAISVFMESRLPKEFRSWGSLGYALGVCKNLGVDPMSGAIWFASMKGKLIPMLHYGMKLGIARRTGELWLSDWAAVYNGEKFSIDYQKKTVEHGAEHTKRSGKPIGAWCRIIRAKTQEQADRTENTYVVYVAYDNYAKSKSDDSAWGANAEVMIEKAAVLRALQRSFPDILSGVYCDEEFTGASGMGTTDKPPAYETTAEKTIEIADDLFAKAGVK